MIALNREYDSMITVSDLATENTNFRHCQEPESETTSACSLIRRTQWRH